MGCHLDSNPTWHHFYLLARAGLAKSVERQALNPTDLSSIPGWDSAAIIVLVPLDPFLAFQGSKSSKKGSSKT